MKGSENRMGKRYSKYDKVETRKINRQIQELSSVQNYISAAPICPYCGERMILKEAKEIRTVYQEGKYFVCKNYDAGCDCYCRVSEDAKKRYKLISTPANRELRMLRKEAHHYLNELINQNIFATKDNLYSSISYDLPMSHGRFIHVGECQEYGCRQIINKSIEILYNNRDKITKFRRWVGTNAETKQSSCMLDEISFWPQSRTEEK